MSETFKKISYGLFVVTTKANTKYTGCIVNTVMQLTTSPNMISVAINKQNYTHDMVKENGEFNVSIISEKADFSLFEHFGFVSGRDMDKFSDFKHVQRSSNGLLFLDKYANSYISCKVISQVDLQTHVMFICDVTQCVNLNDKQTMRFCKQHVDPDSIRGFMTAPWLFTVPNKYYGLLNDAFVFGNAKKDIFGEGEL